MVWGWRSWWLVLTLVCVVCGHNLYQPSYYTQGVDLVAGAGMGLAQLYLPVHVQPESSCGQALVAMSASLADNSTIWAARMVDSWGKNADGMMGNIITLMDGMYDECVSTTSPDHTVKGTYCQILLYPTMEEEEEATAAEWTEYLPRQNNFPNNNPVLKRLLNMDTHRAAISAYTNSSRSLVYGTCMPSECTLGELWNSLSITYQGSGVGSTVIECQVADPELIFTASDIGFICVVAVLSLLVVAASIFDIYIQHTDNTSLAKGGYRFLLPFSAYTNLSKLFHLNTTSSPYTINCLHGMRVLSMTWVIYCHQLGVGAFFGYLDGLFKRTNSLLYQILLNGYPSVDTFFFMSGLLVTYSVLRQLKKTGKFNIFIFYLHRIIRLVPLIALVVWFYATVVRFFVSGPRSYNWINLYENCKKYWWKDVLLVNNYLLDSGDCLGQSWYLSVDFQLYLIAPLLVLPLFWYKAAGRAWLYLVTMASAIIPAAIIYIEDLPPGYVLVAKNVSVYVYDVYVTPWCRAGPWVIGIWLGYFLYSQGNKKVKMRGIVVVVGWTLATLTALLVVFGMWSYNTLKPQAEYDVMTRLAYGGLSRIAWAASLSWVVVACQYGYGGMVNGFLSHPSWQPLSRLTYSIYLVALSMQAAIAYNQRVPYYFTHLNKVVETVGAIAVTLPVAVLLSLLVEAPILGLEKLLLAPGSGQANKTQTSTSPQLPLVLQKHPRITEDSQLDQFPLQSTTAFQNLAFTLEAGDQGKTSHLNGVN